MKTQQCKVVQSQYPNTDGTYNDILICYCGTTGCTKITDVVYPLPKDFLKIKSMEIINPKQNK